MVVWIGLTIETAKIMVGVELGVGYIAFIGEKVG